MSDHNDHAAAQGQQQPGFAPSAPWPYAAAGYPQPGPPPGAWAPPPWAGAAPYPHHLHGGWHGHPGYAAGPWWVPPAAAAAPEPKVGPASNQHHAQHHDLLAGVVVGAAAAYLLSNDKIQSSVIRTAVSLWATVQGGLEEVKERIRDAEAEVTAAKAAAEDGAGAKPE
ncbi:hypothetical protein HNR60_001877 [Rhodopseudomonas rhenobacensis]|uniref:Uncharacterized protein n=1 Tax=Rhodopseudomonas rhenobacensis TaxID=87461 RepID=A0A7W7Z315_9BRAD|nr:hypothetical protein [Rhodopseudomonas rhenobacensis]MBB5047125.1 hypothetical protein [Rhodopseudomonas rhenobacensis]